MNDTNKYQQTGNKSTGLQTADSRNQSSLILQDETVSARSLHERLKSAQQFADWIKKRISNYGFEEGRDFFIKLGKSLGGRPEKEYFLCLDMAKELAMLERSEPGRAIRRYFIEAEKALRAGISTDESAIFAELDKKADPVIINDCTLYRHRRVCEVLGQVSPQGMPTLLRNGWGKHIATINSHPYCTAYFVRIMIANNRLRDMRLKADDFAIPIPENFGTSGPEIVEPSK